MSYRTQQRSGTHWLANALIIFAVVVVIGGVLFFVFFHKVSPGQVGILVDYNQPTNDAPAKITPVYPGRWILVWFNQDLQSYPFSQQSLIMVRTTDSNNNIVGEDDSVDCKDRTGIQVNVDTTVIWKIKPDEVGPLYLNYPKRDVEEIKNDLIRRISRQSVADACGKFGFLEIASTNRIGFADEVTTLLGTQMKREHLELVSVSIGETYLPPEQQKSITDKSVAEQKALEAKFLKEQREAEADALIAQAEGEKTAAILRAEGQAEAARIIIEELGGRDYYIQYLWIDKWNGAVPYTLVASDGTQYPLIVELPAGVTPTPIPPTNLPTPTSPVPTTIP